MMFWYGNGGWHPWMVTLTWIGMFLFWALVIFGVVWLVRGSTTERNAPSPSDPERILQERLARGEIDTEEYQRRHDLIHSRQ